MTKVFLFLQLMKAYGYGAAWNIASRATRGV
jgi:hypothetical protein